MKIMIIGCGNMGGALAERLSPNHTLFLFDRNKEKTEELEHKGFGTSCVLPGEVLQKCDIVILAVKPQGFHDVIKLFPKKLQPKQVLISLLTGITISRIRENFTHEKVVRMMPNLPLMYGEGVIGLAVDKPLADKEIKRLEEICKNLGKVLWMEESKINALAALAGSGPAFIFTLVEAMIDAGIGLGFSAKQSQEIVYQMIKGSLAMLEQTGQHPGELKWKITSPGGTTIAGLRKLEESATRAAIMNTFYAAYNRANELGSRS